MSKYSFLYKPAFFIINLLFATWLVLSIEKLKPSDFGAHSSIFESAAKPRKVTEADKPFLKHLIDDYRRGIIDSTALERKIDSFLAPIK